MFRKLFKGTLKTTGTGLLNLLTLFAQFKQEREF